MTEFKLTVAVEAPDLANAFNNLADALRNRPVAVSSVASVNTCDTAEKPVEAKDAAANPTVAAEAAPTVAAPNPAPQSVPAEAAQTSPTVDPTPAQMNVPPVAVQTAPAVPVQTNAADKSYTIEDITKAGSALLDAGKMSDLMNLLARHGVQAVTMLKPEQFTSVAAGMRELGANI